MNSARPLLAPRARRKLASGEQGVALAILNMYWSVEGPKGVRGKRGERCRLGNLATLYTRSCADYDTFRAVTRRLSPPAFA